MSQTLRKIWIGEAPKDVKNLNDYLDKVKEYDQSYETFRKNKLLKLIGMEYQLDMLGQKWIDIKAHENELKGKLKEQLAVEHNNGYCFITISPKDSVNLEEFIEKVHKYVQRNMFRKSRYVFEQRGKTEAEAGKGFHAHILFKRNLDYKPSKIRVNSLNTWKNMCSCTDNTFNVKHIGEEFAKDKDEYMTGVKTGEDKDLKQAIDIIWRKANNIESVYGEEFFTKK